MKQSKKKKNNKKQNKKTNKKKNKTKKLWFLPSSKYVVTEWGKKSKQGCSRPRMQ